MTLRAFGCILNKHRNRRPAHNVTNHEPTHVHTKENQNSPCSRDSQSERIGTDEFSCPGEILSDTGKRLRERVRSCARAHVQNRTSVRALPLDDGTDSAACEFCLRSCARARKTLSRVRLGNIRHGPSATALTTTSTSTAFCSIQCLPRFRDAMMSTAKPSATVVALHHVHARVDVARRCCRRRRRRVVHRHQIRNQTANINTI